MLSFITGALSNAWLGLSIGALLTGGLGIALIVGAGALIALVPVFFQSFLPNGLKRWLVIAGFLLVIVAVAVQWSRADGVADTIRRGAAQALLAEKLRALKAEKILKADKAQAETDLAAERANSQKLKALLDDVQKRKDAQRLCVDKSVSRRLRDL